MTGKEWDISDQELVEILWREFAVEIDDPCAKELERARMSLDVYKDVGNFWSRPDGGRIIRNWLRNRI